MLRRVRKRLGQAIKSLSFGLHPSEPFYGLVVEQYKMKRGEQVHIYMSEIPGELYNSCGFHLMSPHGNPTSTIKQLCLYVHEYAQVLRMSTFQKNICEYLTAPKNIDIFLELGIFTVFAIFHFRVSAFSKKCKLF